LTLDGTGTIATAQITSYTGGTLSLSAGTFSLPALSDIDGSAFQISGRSRHPTGHHQRQRFQFRGQRRSLAHCAGLDQVHRG